MGDSDEGEVRRTAFAKDSREFFTKFMVGLVVGLALWGGVYAWSGADMTFWFGWILGEVVVFKFASSISGSSRHAD